MRLVAKFLQSRVLKNYFVSIYVQFLFSNLSKPRLKQIYHVYGIIIFYHRRTLFFKTFLSRTFQTACCILYNDLDYTTSWTRSTPLSCILSRDKNPLHYKANVVNCIQTHAWAKWPSACDMHHICSQGAKVVNPLDLLRSFSWKPPESHGHLQIFGKWLQWEILNPWLCYKHAKPSMNNVNIIFLLLCMGRNLFYSFYLELSFLEQMCVYYHCPCLCFLKVTNLSFSIIKSSVLNISWHSWIFLGTLSCKYRQKCMYLQWSAEWEVAICFEFFQFRILGVCVSSPVSASSSSLPVSPYIVTSVYHQICSWLRARVFSFIAWKHSLWTWETHKLSLSNLVLPNYLCVIPTG